MDDQMFNEQLIALNTIKVMGLGTKSEDVCCSRIFCANSHSTYGLSMALKRARVDPCEPGFWTRLQFCSSLPN